MVHKDYVVERWVILLLILLSLGLGVYALTVTNDKAHAIQEAKIDKIFSILNNAELCRD